MTLLPITTAKTMTYNEAESLRFLAPIEKLLNVAVAVLKAIGTMSVRPAAAPVEPKRA